MNEYRVLRLWVDRVGVFLVGLADEFTFGGPVASGDPRSRAADLALLAPLSRNHAAIAHSGERFLLRAWGDAFVNGRPVVGEADLPDNAEIRLGESVRLRFRQPHVLSGTARVDFLSDHRPRTALDGILLLRETLLLGPGSEHHVQCPPGTEPVVLFPSESGFRGRSRLPLDVAGTSRSSAPGDICEIPLGTVVAGGNLRFRLEAWP